MGKHLSYISNVLLIIVIVYLIFDNYNSNRDHKNNANSIIAFYENEKNETLRSNDSLVSEIKLIEQNVIFSQEQIKSLYSEIEDYKKISSVFKTELHTGINDVRIEYVHDSIYVPDTSYVYIDTISKYYIPKNSLVSFSDQWISLDARIADEFIIDSLRVFNKIDIVVGEKKVTDRLLFNKYQPSVEVKSYNPYSNISYANNVIYEKKRKGKFANKLIIVGASFFAGYITGNKTR